MSTNLFFDTETTGLPDWKKPSGDECQPHLVQLAAILQGEDFETSFDVIIKPNGWVIPEETSEIHGITQERALDEGIAEEEALQKFIELYDRCDLRVAHNTTFDNRIIRIALKRYMPDLIPDEVWKDKSGYYCTLINARKIMGGSSGHMLAECYQHFCGKEMESAHNAMADTRACMEIYEAMKNL